MKVTILKYGDQLMISLTDHVCDLLDWRQGDVLEIEVSDKTVKLERAMTADEHAMEIARRAMDEYRETFEALAKS